MWLRLASLSPSVMSMLLINRTEQASAGQLMVNQQPLGLLQLKEILLCVLDLLEVLQS